MRSDSGQSAIVWSAVIFMARFALPVGGACFHAQAGSPVVTRIKTTILYSFIKIDTFVENGSTYCAVMPCVVCGRPLIMASGCRLVPATRNENIRPIAESMTYRNSLSSERAESIGAPPGREA